jgi:hypothetical protein
MSELRLHTNKAVSVEASGYYHAKLYNWGNYAPFLAASMESMMQVFYIELDGFIGAYWDLGQQCVKMRKNEHGSLAVYLYDGKRVVRKKRATIAFESLLRDKSKNLKMINDLRVKLAHFKKLDERSKALVPGDTETREILNMLADVIHLLGFQRWNEPDHMQRDNDSSNSTQSVIDRLVGNDEKAIAIRKTYNDARSKWFGTEGQ